MTNECPHKKRCLSLFLLLAVVTLLAACDETEQVAQRSALQGVQGVVTLTPGWNGEIVDPEPAQPEPRPLANATVYLIWRDITVGVERFADSTYTDSTGEYILPAAPGQYYVAVATRDIAAPVLVSLPGDTTELQRRIHAIVGLNVLEGHFVEQPFNIAEMSTQ